MPTWLSAACTHPIALLMLGGGIGTNARYWLGKLIVQFQSPDVRFPWATFAINVSGSFILGAVATIYDLNRDISHLKWYLLFGTGFCGGFTTFSTFSYETLQLIKEERSWIAVLYALGSVGFGLLGAWLAVKVAGE